MPTAPHDDDVIVRFGVWIAPCLLPMLMMTEGMFEQAESGIMLQKIPQPITM
jgi:hypothetical protein